MLTMGEHNLNLYFVDIYSFVPSCDFCLFIRNWRFLLLTQRIRHKQRELKGTSSHFFFNLIGLIYLRKLQISAPRYLLWFSRCDIFFLLTKIQERKIWKGLLSVLEYECDQQYQCLTIKWNWRVKRKKMFKFLM